ncbi:MAG: insulinase family protein [Gemmatimonadota bacterium]|nr:insulinase family protein [Gemmatimonadota bacterium]
MTLASPPPLSLPLLDPASVYRTVLPNGLRVLVRRDTSAPVVAIVTHVCAGYFDETDDVVGIAHVLEHMYFKGTPTRGVGEIARATKAVGGYLNAATIYDYTTYYTVLPSSGFMTGLEIQFDAYANPLLDAQELARELEVIIQEAKRKADNPHALTIETLYEVLHDRHRIRRWRIGREPGLRALKRDQLLAFYRNFYRPGNTILVIVGDVDPDATLREVERRHGTLPAGEPVRTPGPRENGGADFRYREWAGDVGQTQLAAGWRTPGSDHPDTPHLDLLATALGAGRASRLYRAVRERTLASSVAAYNYTPTELGVFVVQAEGPAATAAAAARAAWQQVRVAREEGLGALELDRAKRIQESRWIRGLETMEGQANHLAQWEALGDWRLGDRYLERLLTATSEQVRGVAQRYLAPERAAVVVYRPETAPQVAADAVAARALIDAGRPEPLPPVGSATATGAAFVATAGPVLDGEEAGVRVYRTSAGVPILVRRKPGAALINLGVYALGGAAGEGAERAGLSTLLVRTALKGTSRRSAAVIAEEGELLGGSVGGAAGVETFGWSISVPSKHARAALELLADVVTDAAYPAEALEIERAVALADVVALRDDMYRYPMRLAATTAFAGHPYGVPVSGTEESLRRLAVEELRAWHAARVLRAHSVIAVVGDVDPDDAAAIAARDLGDLVPADAPVIPRPQWPATAQTAAENRDKAQTGLAMLFASPGRDDDDRFAAAMIAGVASGLGGRFFEELREKHSLCYTVHAFQTERRLGGAFAAYIATSPDKEDIAREGLLREFEKLRTTLVGAEELARAQTYAIGTHAIRQQSGGSVLADVVDAWLFGRLAELDEFETQIRRVTPERMRAVAERYFDPARRVEGIVRGVLKAV